MGRMDWTTRDNPEQARYELVSGDQIGGFAAYEPGDDAVTFTHTEVDSTYEGQGLGSRLVSAALDDVRSHGQQVVPRCRFVADYIDKHDEYADLVAPR